MMLVAILADIHANLAAFTAVLRDIQQRGGVEEYWCLGDIVNYGPDPVKCVELMQRLKHVAIAGNHDLAAIGRVPTSLFNPDAATAMEWTRQQLNQKDISYLSGLAEVVTRQDSTLVHGSPRDPIWEYLLSKSQAVENFNYFKTRICLVAHSHEPLVFRQDSEGQTIYVKFTESLGQVVSNHKMILNPGSVGQPRDGDPRASYAIYDSSSRMVKLYRVVYDVGATQMKMVKANLPLRLVMRLEKGL